MPDFEKICGWTHRAHSPASAGLTSPQMMENIRMPHTFSPLHGACECGTCTFNISVLPSARLICHCTICQAFTGQSYSDVTIVRAKHVTLTNEDQIAFKKYRPPPNLSRGLCLRCKKPVLEFSGFGAFKWAFIPAGNFEIQSLPMPQMHIFYDQHLEDAPDDLPKHSGYLRSQLAIVRMLMGTL